MDAEVVPQSIDLTSALAMDAVLTGHDSFALRIFSVPSAPVGRVQARFRVKEQRFGELPKEVQDTWESDWVAGRDFCYTFATQQHGLTTLRVYPDDTITRESPVGEMGTHTGIAPVGQALVSRLHVDFGNSIWFPRLHRYGVWCDSQMAAKSPGVPYNLTVARCFLPGEKITASQSPKLLDEQHTNGRPARTLFLEKALGERPPPVLILTPPQATITQFFDPDTLTRRADRVTARLPPIEAGYWGSSEAERRARELQRHQGDRVTKKLQIEHRSLDSDPELPYSIDREALTEVDVVRGEILERYGRVPERGEIVLPSPVPLEPTTTLWRFQTFWHPQAVGFRRVLESRGLARLVRIENQQLSRRSAISEGTDLAEQLDRVGYFENEYRPTEYISQPYPRDVVDFAVAGFYSEDNWELFFHCLLYAAQCLDEDGQHDEAEEIWALLLDRSLLVDADAWRKPELFQTAPIRWSLEIEQDRPLTSLIDRDRRRLSAELLAQIQRIHLNPYQPHLIARGWPSVYARMLQIRYCEHLIRAGDAKFRLAFASDNRSLLEIASSIYDFTARCLGPAEGSLARTETAEAACFRSLTAGTGDEAAQAIDLLDAYIPPDIFEDVAPEQLFGLMARRHFCVPPNEKFDELRALVADRLLNLRSCRDIEGVQRALSLYGRRIDPMLLVRATAEGMDLDVVLGRISGARPNMQFEALWQRAVQSCERLRSFEEAWLAAEERAESEEERQLQNSLETAMQEGLLGRICRPWWYRAIHRLRSS